MPKGRTEVGVRTLLADAGIELRSGARGYRPIPSVPWLEAKLLKPQNIVEMLAAGSRDVGFAGADWVAEKQADLVELLDTGLDPVRVVAAAPQELLVDGVLPSRRMVIASELPHLTEGWVAAKNLDADIIRSYGATEVFPPEDADIIVDITATGETLAANGLVILDTVMESSTRLYASQQAMADVSKKQSIEALVLGLNSVLSARTRVMVELNIAVSMSDALFRVLPSMREPTVASLHGGDALAVKAAVLRKELPNLIPVLKEAGATDIVVSRLEQIVP